jgi:hypothetical protein
VCRSACAATPNRRRQLPTDRTRPTCRRRTRTAQVRRWTALAAARPGRSTYRRRESSRLGCARCRARIHLDQTPECSTGGGSANGAGVVVTAAGGRAFCHRDQPLGPAGGVDDSWRCRPGICSTSQSRSLASAAISSCGSEHQLAATSRPFGSSQPQVLRSEYAICRGRWMVGSSGSVVSYVLAAGCSKLVNSVWPRSLSVSSRSTGWPTPVSRSVPWAARWWACTRAPRQEQSRKVRRRGPVAGGRVRTRTADSGRRVVDQLRRGPPRRRRGWCSVAAFDRAITPATSTGRCLPTAPAPGSSQLVRHGDAPAQR